MITTINEFRKIFENVGSDNGYAIIIDKFLAKTNDLQYLDMLLSFIYENGIFDNIPKEDEMYSIQKLRELDRMVFEQLAPSWINKLWMDNLKNFGKSMNDVYEYATVFSKWIENKGYTSQEVYLCFIPGGSLIEYDKVEEFKNEFQFDMNNLDSSIDTLFNFMKNTPKDMYNQGYFRMGFDVFPKEVENNDGGMTTMEVKETAGFAIFAFNMDCSLSEAYIEEIDFNPRYCAIEPNKETNKIGVNFMPNTSLFYSYKPQPPYKDMDDYVSESGFTLRLD